MSPRPPASLAELRQRYLEKERPVPKGLVEELEARGSAAAIALAAAIKKKKAANRAEGQRLRHMLKFENELYAQGHEVIAGVDEAGMSPLAGPVVAGAAILPKGYKLAGLDDSKKISTEEDREALRSELEGAGVIWGVGFASHEEIDAINIYHAGLLAMRRAVEALSVRPDFCLVDARKIPGISQPQKGIIKGDALSLSIAAASIFAKTTRDRHMSKLDAEYPGYGFAQHKGYGVPEHLAALDKLGVTPFHRRSFAPVRKAMGLIPVQAELFAEERAEAGG